MKSVPPAWSADIPVRLSAKRENNRHFGFEELSACGAGGQDVRAPSDSDKLKFVGHSCTCRINPA